MSDENHVRIRIARGSKEALEQLRGSLDEGELFWQPTDPINDETKTNIGITESNEDVTQ